MAKKFVLTYSYNETQESMTEYATEYFSSEEKLHSRVNELSDKYHRFNPDCAGELSKEWTYERILKPTVIILGENRAKRK